MDEITWASGWLPRHSGTGHQRVVVDPNPVILNGTVKVSADDRNGGSISLLASTA
jgi:hypothetical protein